MFSFHSRCRLFQEKGSRAVVKAFREDMAEALKSEIVQVLVGLWLLPVKGTIEQMDQTQLQQRLDRSNMTVILFSCGRGKGHD